MIFEDFIYKIPANKHRRICRLTYAMNQLSIHLFGPFQAKIDQQEIDKFRSYKVRALLAYLIVEGDAPVTRADLAKLLWHGYEAETAQASLRSALSNLRQILKPFDLLVVTRHSIRLKSNHPTLWSDLLILQRFLGQADELDLVAWQQFAPTVQRPLLDGFQSIDSAPFQVWLADRQSEYQQRLLQFQRTIDQRQARAKELPAPNLPRSLTPLIGREGEITELCRHVVDRNYPLITLTGEGGVGKTRLALAVAQRIHPTFVSGVYFVSMATIAVNERVEEQLTLAIGVQLKFDFHASAPLSQQLFAYLHAKEILLILDNFEHLYESAEFLLNLLAAAPQITMLVTSRRRLDFQAEWVMQLKGLPMPPLPVNVPVTATAMETAMATAAQNPSVQLFVERAARTTPGFTLTEQNRAAIYQICRFVNGLPLGLELAAALVEYSSCEAVADTLQDNYRALRTTLRDLPTRQRSMQSVLETSWRMLAPLERTTLMRCSIFRGTFSLDAALVITDATALQLDLLEAHSLLQSHGTGRFYLHDLVGQFAAEQFAARSGPLSAEHSAEQSAGDLEDALRDRHAAYYLTLLAAWQEGVTDERCFQETIQGELENVRAAWQWALRQTQIEALASASEGFYQFYQLRGLTIEAEVVFSESVAHLRQHVASDANPTVAMQKLFGNLLLKLAKCYKNLSQSANATLVSEELLTWAARLNDPLLTMGAYSQLAVVAWVQGEYARQYELLTEALHLAQQHQQVAEQIACYAALGLHGSATQTYAAAREALQKGLALADQYNYRSLRLTVLTNLGIIYRDMGDFSQAMDCFRENLHLSRQIGKPREIVLVIGNLGTLALLLGDYAMALAYLDEAQQLIGKLGEQRIEAELLALHAILYEQMGDAETALRYCQQTLDLATRQQYYHPAREAWITRGHLHLRQGAFSVALAAYQQANELSESVGVAEELLQGQAAMADVLLAQGQPAAALAEIEALLLSFDEARLNPFQSPQRILLTCYHVLAANRDDRAPAILQRAAALLQRQALQISDLDLRHSYLHQVPANRELMLLVPIT